MSNNTNERRATLLRALEALRDAPADARQQTYYSTLAQLYQLLLELEQQESTGVDITPDPEPEDLNDEIQTDLKNKLAETVSAQMADYSVALVQRWLRGNQLALVDTPREGLVETPDAGYLAAELADLLRYELNPESQVVDAFDRLHLVPAKPARRRVDF